MRITYDSVAKAVYIRTMDVPEEFWIVAHTVELEPNKIFIDRTKNEEVYGIELHEVDGITVEVLE